MAREVITRDTCDRCKKLLAETPGTGNDQAARNMAIEVDASAIGGRQVLFEDLCPPCRDRVNALVDQIALVKDDKKQENDSSKDTPAPPAHSDTKEKKK